MRRRACVRAAALAVVEASVAACAAGLGLGAGACQPPAPAPRGLVAGTLGGVEEEILRFVAQASPELGLRVLRFSAAEAVRAALNEGQIALGSFENGVELAEKSADSAAAGLASAGPSVTLPLGLYSRRLRTLSELEPGSRIALSSAASSQARALLVLYHYGLLDFDQELGPRVRLSDVRRNPRQLQLTAVADRELSAQMAGAQLVALDYDAASRSGLEPARQALAIEDGFSPFAQVLTVRRQDQVEQPRWLQRFLLAYRSAPVKAHILQRYEDSVRRAW